MKLVKTLIEGAYLIELEKYQDERGIFARQFCKTELANYGIDFDIKQCNLSVNYKKGVLRGLHYQKEPFPEAKIVSCFSGKIYDVIVDIRPNSSTYKKWIAVELSEDNGLMLYIPSGVAHGFQTLQDNTTVFYQLNEYFHQECYSGVRWNDPSLDIKWHNCDNLIINERDANYELL